jgi:hypothetical protein
MQYPRKFSDQARSAVVAELIRAERLQDERQYSDRTYRHHESLRTCILTVFRVYGRQAIKLGQNGVWTPDEVLAEALEGLRRLTIEITTKRNHYAFLVPEVWTITRESQLQFKASTEWKQFEEELLVLADSKRRSLPDRVPDDGSEGPLDGGDPAKARTALGRNIEKLRKECGWSLDDLAQATELDKKLILGHVKHGKGTHPKTLEIYARTFTEKMGRHVTVAELES